MIILPEELLSERPEDEALEPVSDEEFQEIYDNVMVAVDKEIKKIWEEIEEEEAAGIVDPVWAAMEAATTWEEKARIWNENNPNGEIYFATEIIKE